MSSESSNEKRDGERVGASLRLKLKYPDVETFVEKFATNISKGGVFIASRTPKAVGTPLRFELTLENGQRLIKGEGTVAWVKEFDPKQPTKAHGMGLKFTKLDNESRVLVDRMLAIKQRREDARAAGDSGAIVKDAITPELTPVLAQPVEPRRPAPPRPPPPPATDFDNDDATRADAAPMTIMMDVGTSGVAVRREPPPLPQRSVPPPLPKPAPPPLSSGQNAAITITGGWAAATGSAVPPSMPVPPPLPPPAPVKVNGTHPEHLDLGDGDETTLPVATPPDFQGATPLAQQSRASLPAPPLPPTVGVSGDVETMLAQADQELAALGAEPHELPVVLERARKLAEGVDVDTLLLPD